MERRNFFRALMGMPVAGAVAGAASPSASKASNLTINVSCDNSQALRALDEINERLTRMRDLSKQLADSKYLAVTETKVVGELSVTTRAEIGKPLPMAEVVKPRTGGITSGKGTQFTLGDVPPQDWKPVTRNVL